MALAGFAACGGSTQQRLVLGATHTLEDSGLLDVLVDSFGEESPADRLAVVVAGSGEILAMAARGDVDVLLSHSPEQERHWIEAGALTARAPVMTNHFLLAGPATDPAGVRAANTAGEAFSRIAASNQPFVSRGDGSGTHSAEQKVWREAGRIPSWSGYIEAGTGMSDALRLASQRGAYVLTDQATFEAVRPALDLEPLYEKPAELPNPYSVLVSTRAGNRAGAERFVNWVTSARAADIIARHEAGGRSVYTPVTAQ